MRRKVIRTWMLALATLGDPSEPKISLATLSLSTGLAVPAHTP
jgi:hypothetical protein